VMPASSIHEVSRRWTCFIGSERKVRVVNPGSVVHCASSRHRSIASRALEPACFIRSLYRSYIRTWKGAEERDNDLQRSQYQNAGSPHPETVDPPTERPLFESIRPQKTSAHTPREPARFRKADRAACRPSWLRFS